MTKRTRFTVHYGCEVARFSHYADALCFGRMITIGGGRSEVVEATGIIGQFHFGNATPEFSHLDAGDRS